VGLRNVWRPPVWKVDLSSYWNDSLFINAVQKFHHACKKPIKVSLSLAHPVLYRAFSKDLFRKQPKRVIGYIDLWYVVLMESSRMGRENTTCDKFFLSNVLLYIKRLLRSTACRENKQHEATNISSFSKLFFCKIWYSKGVFSGFDELWHLLSEVLFFLFQVTSWRMVLNPMDTEDPQCWQSAGWRHCLHLSDVCYRIVDSSILSLSLR